MTKTKILTLIMIPVTAFLAWRVYHSIADVIIEAKEIKVAEARVTEKLKQIRKAEVAYFNRYKTYTASWDTLIDFVETDTIFTVEKREIITPRTKNDPLYYTRTDSVRIEYDTIAREQALLALFPTEEYPKFSPERLPFVPGTDKKFEIWAGNIEKGNVAVPAVEVVDPAPRDPSRKDSNPSPTRWRLRFGSQTDATTSGNWE
ncbi:hypothetical protein V6R21_23115 [Limibacter armeniacum]|uniref:hypothetical protein n=1 Tax=Limibacter armeniacum TaxID=466084 RepID=UPI002FE5292D